MRPFHLSRYAVPHQSAAVLSRFHDFCRHLTHLKKCYGPGERPAVRTQFGLDEMANGGNPMYSDGDDRDNHIYVDHP